MEKENQQKKTMKHDDEQVVLIHKRSDKMIFFWLNSISVLSNVSVCVSVCVCVYDVVIVVIFEWIWDEY